MRKLKVLIVFGTRPEIIKLAPFIKAVEADPECMSVTCATTQHRALQNDILDLFKIKVDHDLDIMKEGQDLFYITEKILSGLKVILAIEKPDYIVVQGDTTTAFSAALAGFYQKIPVVHIEAGLRTGNIYSPYPEEANRLLISRIATLHMAPTQAAIENLSKEGIIENVFKTGNTIVDSVYWVLENFIQKNEFIKKKAASPEKKVLITVHRRENFGEPFKEICNTILDLCKQYPKYSFIWPVHPNPNIKLVVYELLKDVPNLHLIEPLSYADLLFLINASSVILSDSGGIQEEACILGKNIIILREDTERPEVVDAGYGLLAGSNRKVIFESFDKFLKAFQDPIKNKVSKEIYGTRGVSENILLKIKNQ